LVQVAEQLPVWSQAPAREEPWFAAPTLQRDPTAPFVPATQLANGLQLFVQVQLPALQIAEQVPFSSQVPLLFWPLLPAGILHCEWTGPL
jgi:hypothetical protein